MKRLPLTILLFLLLGAAMNVAVAWTISVQVDPEASEPVGETEWLDHGTRWAFRYRAFGTAACEWRSTAGATFFFTMEEKERLGFHRTPADVLPRWAKGIEDTSYKGNMVLARGWPCLALWSQQEWFQCINPKFESRGGIQTGLVFRSSWMNPPRVLPLRPIWPAFAINTVFYAAFLWVLIIFTPRELRRHIRRRRGRCLKCGYDLRGNTVGGPPEVAARSAGGADSGRFPHDAAHTIIADAEVPAHPRVHRPARGGLDAPCAAV